MYVSHEALSIVIWLYTIIKTIIPAFLVIHSMLHPLASDCSLVVVVVVIGIFAFDCEQFIVSL